MLEHSQLATVYVLQRVTMIVLVIQSPPRVKTHFGLGVAHNFKPFCALLHERNKSPWSCVLKFAKSTQFSLPATRWMSDSEFG